MLEIREIENELELKSVLQMCYSVFNEIDHDLENSEIYGYSAWEKRLKNHLQPMVYAVEDKKIVSAVLGRAENSDSMVIGIVACDEKYRRRGITKQLMIRFEGTARKMGYKYITLGSFEDSFYEHCGYNVIFKTHNQNIYQKIL